jgi:hypothetical protein
MWSRLARVAAALALAVIPTLMPAASAPASASTPPGVVPVVRGQDVCPEPNDTFQAACYLGRDSDALGFISSPKDVDAYRIEVYDFNTDVHIEMPSMPAPYKVELANWNGDVIATSNRNGAAEIIDTTLDIPGAYYIFVHSANGGFSDAQPYQIFRALTYPGSSIPEVIHAVEFREGSQDSIVGETDYAVHLQGGGKYTIQSKLSGSVDDPSQAWWTGFGEELTDFTMTLDARVVNKVDAGFSVFFRHNGDDNTYQLAVDAKDGQTKLLKVVNGEYTSTDWKSSTAIDTDGGVNRVVIRCFQDDIRVNINGEDVFDISDGSFRKGHTGIGIIAFGPPPVVSFDNIIITTPTEG